jgi:hypothetical protein
MTCYGFAFVTHGMLFMTENSCTDVHRCGINAPIQEILREPMSAVNCHHRQTALISVMLRAMAGAHFKFMCGEQLKVLSEAERL